MEEVVLERLRNQWPRGLVAGFLRWVAEDTKSKRMLHLDRRSLALARSGSPVLVGLAQHSLPFMQSATVCGRLQVFSTPEVVARPAIGFVAQFGVRIRTTAQCRLWRTREWSLSHCAGEWRSAAAFL